MHLLLTRGKNLFWASVRETVDVCGLEKANVRALVEVVEPMGSETYLHLNIGGQKTIIRAAPDCRPAIAETIGLYVDTGRIHLFRADNGQSLRS